MTLVVLIFSIKLSARTRLFLIIKMINGWQEIDGLWFRLISFLFYFLLFFIFYLFLFIYILFRLTSHLWELERPQAGLAFVTWQWRDHFAINKNFHTMKVYNYEGQINKFRTWFRKNIPKKSLKITQIPKKSKRNP